MQEVITATLWFAALSTGIMAGVYFTFSVFVMQALDAAGRPVGMAGDAVDQPGHREIAVPAAIFRQRSR